MGPNYKSENGASNLRPERGEYSLFSVKEEKVPYVTDLLGSRLGCACYTDIYTAFDNPGDVEESTNSLNHIAY